MILDAADLAIIETYDDHLTPLERTLLAEVRRLQQEMRFQEEDHAEHVSQLESAHEEAVEDARGCTCDCGCCS